MSSESDVRPSRRQCVRRQDDVERTVRTSGRPGPKLGAVEPSVKDGQNAWLVPIRQAFLDSGMTCKDLAEQTRAQKSRISELMRGKGRYPRLRHVVAIATVLEPYLLDTTLPQIRRDWLKGADQVGKSRVWISGNLREKPVVSVKPVAVSVAYLVFVMGFLAGLGILGGDASDSGLTGHSLLPEYAAPAPRHSATPQLEARVPPDTLVYRVEDSLRSPDPAELWRAVKGTTLVLDCKLVIKRQDTYLYLKVSGSERDYVAFEAIRGSTPRGTGGLPECPEE